MSLKTEYEQQQILFAGEFIEWGLFAIAVT